MVGKEANEAELQLRIASGSVVPTDYFQLGAVLASELRVDEAVAVYEAGFARGLPDVARAYCAWRIGSLLHGWQGRASDAIGRARDALSLLVDQPTSQETLVLRGVSNALIARAAESADDLASAAGQQAIHDLEELLAKHGISEDTDIAYLELAWVYRGRGQSDEVVRCCEAYLRWGAKPGERALAFATLADALRVMGRLGQAEDAMMKALSYKGRDLDMDRPAMYVGLALIYAAAQRHNDARRTLEQALDVYRRLSHQRRKLLRDIYWYLAEQNYRVGDFERAVRGLEQLLAEFPQDPQRCRALTWLGDCCVSMNRPSAARRRYEEALSCHDASEEERTSAIQGLAELPPD